MNIAELMLFYLMFSSFTATVDTSLLFFVVVDVDVDVVVVVVC